MTLFDLDAYVQRSRALDVSDIDWAAVPRHTLSPGARRTLRYMQDIETHTLIYLKELLATRAVDDPDIATFLPCWVYEEMFHGRALARFLAAAGEPVSPRPRSALTASQRLEALSIALVSRVWPQFVAVHMTWGAINELTTLTGYNQLAARAGHPVLETILTRIVRDESRHFGFYFQQAEQRLAQPATARIVRWLVDRFWTPVGSGVQPAAETHFIANFLFSGADGRAAARKIDETIRRLPGFSEVQLFEAWLDKRTETTGIEAHHAAARGVARGRNLERALA